MITPISLESEIEVVERQLENISKVGAKKFHIDIIDGLFVDNITVSPADLQQVEMSEVAVDLHLLVDDPVEWIEECVALKPARIFAQIERMGNIEYYIETLRGYGNVGVGLGVGLHTPINSLTNGILEQIDGVILMSIEMGYGGTPFHPEVLEKIKELRKRWSGQIVIDGGINSTNYVQVMEAGASEAGANSSLWKGDFIQNWRAFEEAEKQWQKQ